MADANVLSTPPFAGVPSLSLESFGDYTQRSTHRSTQRSTQRSIASSEGTPLDQKQARLQAARQRQVEQRREGVAMALLLQSSLDRACMACRALQRWREFSARADPASPQPPPGTTKEAAAAATPAALDAHDAEFRSRAGIEAAYKQREAALLSQLRDAEVAIQRAEKRALQEIRLLNHEAREELRERLLHAERETQATLLGHVYEKQQIAAVHQKALQEAEFAKLDMLAQQEARAKLRESRQFDAVQKQLGQLRSQLEERQAGADEMLRLLAAEEQAQEELRALRSQLSNRRASEAPTPDAPTPAAPTTDTEAPPEGEGGQSSDMPDWLAEAAAETSPATEAPPTPAPAPAPAPTPAPAPAPSPALTPGGYAVPSEAGDAPTTTLAAARELEELRRRLAAAEAREAVLRRRHEEEVQQCDEQAARLREALRSQAKRLDETEAQLHEAQQAARHAAEEARSTRAAAEEQTQQWQAAERARQQRQPPHGSSGGALPHRPPQVRTSDDQMGTPGGLSPLSEGAAEVSFDLGAELLAQRAQELFAEMPFGSPFGSPRHRSSAPSPLSRRSAAPSPRS